MSALMADRRDWAEDPRQASLFDALEPIRSREVNVLGRVVGVMRRVA